MSAGGRNGGIDTLRGVAIGAVLILHFGLAFHLFRRIPALGVLRWGNFGVTMFFAVSGYLIAGNVLRRDGALGRVRLGPFYRRRAARIAPPLMLALLVIVPLGIAGVPGFRGDGGQAGTLALFAGNVASVLTFTHNLFMQRAGYSNYCLDVYWSLSVEEVFYAGFPLLCLMLRRDGPIALACLAAIVVAPLVRHAAGDDDIVYLYGDLACFDAIAIGILAALTRAHFPALRRRRRLLVGGGIAAIVATWPGGFETDARVMWTFPAIAAGTAAILLGAPHETPGWTAPLRWMGRHSYELYLFHIVVLAALRDVAPAADRLAAPLIPALFVIFVSGSALAAVLAARLLAGLRRPVPRAAPA